MKMKDEELEALFNAVDDYLYSEVPGKGYPEGHCNPRYLEALRQAFLVASTPSGAVTRKGGLYMNEQTAAERARQRYLDKQLRDEARRQAEEARRIVDELRRDMQQQMDKLLGR